MARRLGAWDCEYCETKRILGNIFDCPGCGRPRSKRVRFYTIPDGPIVTPEIAKELGSGGPNWYCEHCESGNKDVNTTCWNCGASKGSSPTHEVRKYKSGQAPQSTEEAEQADDDNESWVKQDVRRETQSFSQHQGFGRKDARETRESKVVSAINPFSLSEKVKTKNIAIGLASIAGLALLIFLVYQFFFKTHEEKVIISGFNWVQSVTVQEYQMVDESSWTTHPEDAYNVSSDYKDTGRDEKITDGWRTVDYQDTCYETVSYQDTCTRQVYESRTCTGQRDNGDGSFSDYSYECGSNTSETYSCTNTRQEPYSCTKTREEEIYHYEDIYDWYYEYDIDKWIAIAEHPTSGTDHSPYYFADYILKYPYSGLGAPYLGQQQQFKVPGTYSATFYCRGNIKVGDNGYFSKEYSLEEWSRLDAESQYIISVNAFNGILAYPDF